MNYLICIGATAVYLLIGFGTRALFQKAEHPSRELWYTPLVWPIPLILAALSTDFMDY